MKKLWLVCLVSMLIACEDLPADEASVRVEALGTDYYPTLTDSNAVDGVCSTREAIRAANGNVAVDTCPAGLGGTNVDVIHLPAGTFTASIAGVDNTAMAGDLDVAGNLRVVGDSMATTVLDMAGIDRAFHVSGAFALELENLTIKNGCANGGSCNTVSGGTIAAGGGLYHNSMGSLHINNVRFEANTAGQGAGFAICAPTAANVYLVENVEVVNNTAVGLGGGGVDVHMNWTFQNSFVSGNTASNSNGVGGGIRQWDRTGTLINVTVRDNVSNNAGGGVAVVGLLGMSSGNLVIQDSELDGNIANTFGGNVFVQASSGGSALYNVPCMSPGCTVSLDDTIVTDGVADSPTSAPAGSGGNLYANPSSSAPGRISLYGTTAVSGGVDSTTPVAVDCEGSVTLYDSSSVAVTTGCTITDNRPVGPVCNGEEVEEGEDCELGDPCCTDCVFDAADTSCSDGDACTVGDACDGAGVCVAGTGSTCGNGTLESACEEECDDGDVSSGDGCSASCQTETCVVWE